MHSGYVAAASASVADGFYANQLRRLPTPAGRRDAVRRCGATRVAAGALNGYVLNSRWTFDTRHHARTHPLHLLRRVGRAFHDRLLRPPRPGGRGGEGGGVRVAVPPVTGTLFLANRYGVHGRAAG